MQIVVMIDRDPYDSFMGAMQQLKACMLQFYAQEKGLECKRAYHKFFEWYVVEVEEEKGSNLVHRLASRGCSDIHVYTEDEVSAKWLEFNYGRLFRVCRCHFKEETV